MIDATLKRALDLAIALPLVIISAPLVAALALAVRLESPGDPIYRQTRVGRHGRLFGHSNRMVGTRFYFRILQADSETNANAFKRFTHSPTLYIQYDKQPTPPTGLATSTAQAPHSPSAQPSLHPVSPLPRSHSTACCTAGGPWC